MTGTTAVTGHSGKAVVGSTLITRLTSWRINVSTGESAWGDSESQGYTNRKAARADASGTIMGKFESTRKPYNVLLPGDILSVALWNTQTALDYWYFPKALIQTIEYEVSPDSCEVIGWQSNFAADGIFYPPGASGATQLTLPSS